ncbi:MAG: hypothetical protein AAB692_04620 [Patescibacteria group bacterium]
MTKILFVGTADFSRIIFGLPEGKCTAVLANTGKEALTVLTRHADIVGIFTAPELTDMTVEMLTVAFQNMEFRGPIVVLSRRHLLSPPVPAQLRMMPQPTGLA